MVEIPSELISEALFFKFIKFGLVGASGLIVDFAATYLLKERVEINKYLANGIGFALAASSNFALNRYWTFASTDPAIFQQYSKFLVISTVGLAFNHIIVYYLAGRGQLNFYFSKGISIAIVVIWNFLANYYYTFTYSA
ncbi:GtrA family protein [Tunicatimonas pelagia]|uniref:GtrA family protein n=1 Tax=Tunicatimonas pelagia TaxID=931531 RepID=UPI002666917C|nr:GtrA family protein [Tunicatimonas pelagia]WKN40830.1 GtrA family protein [Tunicatimonas pelagia]